MTRRTAAAGILGVLFVTALLVARFVTDRAAPAGALDTGRPPGYVEFTETIMSSPVMVKVRKEDGAAAARIVFDVFRDVDARMSEWKPTSPLSAVNLAAGGPAVAVPDDLLALIRRGVEIGELTGGAFDVTWAAMWGLWDFTAPAPRVPADGEIARRIALVDYRRVEIDDTAGTVRLPENGMLLGLGGIAKGYALDVAAQALRERGVESFLISAGGQVAVAGMRGDRPWRCGIRDPRGSGRGYFAFVDIFDVSASTSGDYERFFVEDGVRYHHVLDPRTGRPARGVRSATVITADATLADALSTALMVMGTEDALALVERLDGVEAVIVDDAAEVHVTDGLFDAFKLVHWPAKE